MQAKQLFVMMWLVSMNLPSVKALVPRIGGMPWILLLKNGRNPSKIFTIEPSMAFPRKLAGLIEHNKDTFAKGPTDLGQTSVVTHHIDTGTSKPIKQQPRWTPKAFEGEEEKILQEQRQVGVIQESSSPWASPIVYVRKKDGSIRPCVHELPQT